MSKTILYSYSQKDIENLIELTIEKFTRNSSLPNEHINLKSDRLTQNQACKLLGITPQTIINWKKKNLIPFYKINGAIFYSKNEILELAHQNKALLHKYSRKEKA
ncbi:helix-turn-helix domain-containing protein [Wenyingzhuangia aestuarii]|uniref:helix-turn-helix domain-containing protein n=1 Tax=Wenyingzhuangia aestuarii TaxID=1647582 RepID=UPI00143B7BBB|nr:helix-turn-helix domain-containing protein [Wenyingzhuangia aestuarii]NJB83124.1 DNA-binding XRE family transcriptional regulator [Wenyingzhuangia aestuarii]